MYEWITTTVSLNQPCPAYACEQCEAKNNGFGHPQQSPGSTQVQWDAVLKR
jgi:hypothetical protein